MNLLILDDGNRGNLNQVLGITAFLPQARVHVQPVEFRGPRYRLPGRKGTYAVVSKLLALLCRWGAWGAARRLLDASSTLPSVAADGPWDAVLSAGSYLAPANLILARALNARSIVLMVPAVLPLRLFDLAIVPRHDAVRLRRHPSNLLVTFGAPNRVTPEKLAAEAEKLAARIGATGGPAFLGIIIGGDDQNYRISPAWARRLTACLRGLDDGFRFLLTTSKRTDPAVVDVLQECAAADPRFLYAEFPGRSPESHYHGILGLSDRLAVTEDSVNMVSEAVTTGKPTLVLGVERKRRRRLPFDRSIDDLTAAGRAAYLAEPELERLGERLARLPARREDTVNEAALCAQKISELIRSTASC